MVNMFVVVWCLALWLVCLCLVLSGPCCRWYLLLVVLCDHQCTSAREWSVSLHLRRGLSVCDVLYAVLYVRVRYFVVRGCAISRKYINVCNCYMFGVVNVP